jgi:putative ABC transport system permease protein
MIANAIWMALRQIARNPTRAALTGLGILIGVASVILMVNLGQGATASIEEDLASMGQNMVIVTPGADRGPGSRTSARPFDRSDADAIAAVDHVAFAAPVASTSVTAQSDGEDRPLSVTGSTSDFATIQQWQIASGRMFDEGEQRGGAAVCVLGTTAAQDLFDGQALGATLRLGSVSCEVVGVFAPKGANTMGMDQDDFALVPIATVQRRLLGTDDVATVLLSVDSEAHLDAAIADIETTLRARRHIAPGATDDFELMDTREMASMVSGITGTLTVFLSAIAGISLVVGGIGVMNIMLVSVTERTREIGLRMAVGALERDVLTQFLLEAVMLSGLGGVAGVVLGVALTVLGATLLDVPIVVNGPVVLGAVVFSGLMGVVFGFLPARRAARLEPVDALRAE